MVRRVVIVQRRLTHYRVPMFELLRESLGAGGIGLDLLVGEGTARERERKDAGEIAWARKLPTLYFAGGKVCWQPYLQHLHGADLVVVTQENGLLANHLLLWRSRPFKRAFWGHGANLQSKHPNGLRERFKRWTTTRADWWFAYTDLSAELVRSAGFPDSQITVLNNTVDTSEMERVKKSLDPAEVDALRRSLGFQDHPVGVFLGSLDAPKRLAFLLRAAEAIRIEMPEFRLLIIGDGAERRLVEDWCGAHPWARWLGSKYGREKAILLALGRVLLNPGAVGLGILDSFVFELPTITTNCGLHGPEIAYLQSNHNGLVTADDLNAYVKASIELLRNPKRLAVLRDGCGMSAKELTLENMVDRFSRGVEGALALNAR